jgi:hypothetical protein
LLQDPISVDEAKNGLKLGFSYRQEEIQECGEAQVRLIGVDFNPDA